MFAVSIACSGCKADRPPSTLADLAERIDDTGAIVFRTDIDFDAKQIFERYGALFDLPPDTTMRLVEDRAEPSGDAQLRFQQFHRGIEVEGADFLIRTHHNRAQSAIGKLVHQFAPTESTPKLSEERAWDIARSQVSDTKIPPSSSDSRPHGSLVYTAVPNSTERVLAWRFDAPAESTQKTRRIYVDAMLGSIVKDMPIDG